MNPLVGEPPKGVMQKRLVSSTVLVLRKDKPTRAPKHEKWLPMLTSLNTYKANV